MMKAAMNFYLFRFSKNIISTEKSMFFSKIKEGQTKPLLMLQQVVTRLVTVPDRGFKQSSRLISDYICLKLL